jgi:type I restriction enzyme S subunit
MSELPDGWIMAPLEDVGNWGSGGTPKRTNPRFYSNGAIPWLVIGDLNDGIVTYAKTHITEAGLLNSSAKLLPPKTLLVAMYGSIGKLGITGIKCATNQAIAFCRIHQEAIELRYLFYALKNSRDSLVAKGQGGAQQNINQNILKAHQIPIAPLKEQKRIADKLDALFMRIGTCQDRLERIPSILKRFRQAILAAAMLGNITQHWREENPNVESASILLKRIQDENIQRKQIKVGKGIQEPFDLPQKWKWVRLIDICRSITDGTHQSPPKSGSGVPFLTISNISKGKLDFNQIRYVPEEYYQAIDQTRKPYEGDILYTVVGATYGIPVLVNTNERFCFQRHIAIIKPSYLISNKYLLYLLKSDFVYKQATDAVTGTAQPTLPLSGLRQIKVPFPPLEEQNEIVRRVEALFAYADRIEACYQNACTKIERLKATLLSKAFRGELVPQDPNDEAVSVLLEKIRTDKNLIETERKTKRLVRGSTEESQKNTMKQPLDYLAALRSAFVEIGRKADARQLFDQAGFNKDDVVQFYEALRATPEVRFAFEERVEELPQQQTLISESTDNKIITNGFFRLVELWLEDFKNLSDYTVRFDSSHSIDIVLGWNGTGKSNLFEALVIIFRDLHEWVERNRWTEKLMKGYRLSYQINQHIVEVSWLPGEMKRPNLKMGILPEGMKEPYKLESISRGKLPLPRFVFGYYSGPTNRLADHFLPMKQAHYERLRKATSDDAETLTRLLEQRRFFCAENHHAKYVLLAFCHKEDANISRFLEDRLRIVGFESALFIIRKPIWARRGQSADDFWGATGIMRRVMERLRRFAIAPMVVEQTVSDGYRSRREDHYYFFLPDLQSLHAFAAEYQNARTFFLALESTDFSELIYDLKIQVRVKATHTEQVAITFHELSEGEQQLLMVLGLMRFTKSHQSLVLLDEPDTHLNPHWNVDYLKLLTHVMSENSGESEEQQTSQILMSTHDPLVIASLVKEQIHLLKRDLQTGVCKWEQPTVNPRGLGFTGILTSEMFGMRSDLDEETLADLDNKVRLVAKEDSLTLEEFAELEKINKRLEDTGFQKAFSDPYYAAFVRAWGRRYGEFMAGVRFLNPAQQEEIDRIAREVLEETIAQLQGEVED